MRHTSTLILASLLALLLSSYAFAQEDFTASAQQSTSLCPCSGQGYYVTITNTGTTSSTYTLSVNKEVEEWASITPATFSLAPNTQTRIPLTFDSPCDTQGTIPVSVIISTSSGLAKAINQQLTFVPCYGFRLTPGRPAQGALSGTVTVEPFNGTYQACADDTLTIPLLVQNIDAAFDNSYTLRTNTEKAEISPSQFALKAGSAGVVALRYTPEKRGPSSLIISGTTGKGEVTLTKELSFESKDCYTLLVDIPQEEVELCGGIPEQHLFRVANRGSFQENITLTIEGADWASIDRPSASLNPARRVNRTLLLSPPAGIEGLYPLTVRASLARNAGIAAEDEVSVAVSSLSECYNAQISTLEKAIARGETYVPVTITNTGSKPAEFSWNISGAEWASVEVTGASLTPEESYHATIRLLPTEEVAQGKYPLTFTVISPYTTSREEIVVEFGPEHPLVTAIKDLFFTYRYYLYALTALLIVLFFFRNSIIDSYRERRKQRLIRESRLEALKKAREARMKMAKKSGKAAKKVEDTAPSSGFGIGTLLLIVGAILLGLLIALFPTRTMELAREYGLAAGGILLACVILAIFLYRPKRRKRKK